MKKIWFLVPIIALLIAFSLGFYLIYSQRDISNKSTEKQTEEKIDYSKDVDSLTQSAWIPYWDYTRGQNTLELNQGKFDSISPVIYEVNENGSLKKTKGDTYKNLQNFAQSNDLKFVPSIAMFDHELFTKVLQDSDNFDRHIDSILDEISNNDFDGIDLDYESTKLDDKAKYEEFITKLAEEIKNLEDSKGKDLTLSVTVLPQWDIQALYPSLNETRQVQDWEFLSQYADEIRIMAYDYTSQAAANPGPIAPIEWIKLVLDKAVRDIPRDKIILGIHTYGYNWDASDVNKNPDFLFNRPTDKLQADAYTYDQIQAIKEQYDGEAVPEKSWEEVILYYTRPEGDRILIYIDSDGIQARKELAAQYGLKGISFWRLGGDTELEY